MSLNPGAQIYYGEVQQTMIGLQKQKDIYTNQLADIEAQIDLIDQQLDEGQKTLNFLDDGSVGVLPTPSGFAIAQANEELDLSWTDDAAGYTYTIERALDKDFTNTLTPVYTGTWTASVADTGLDVGTRYYYRIKSELTGKVDSLYAFADQVAINM